MLTISLGLAFVNGDPSRESALEQLQREECSYAVSLRMRTYLSMPVSWFVRVFIEMLFTFFHFYGCPWQVHLLPNKKVLKHFVTLHNNK